MDASAWPNAKLKRMASKGDPDACCELGLRLLGGALGNDQDVGRALELLSKAADAGKEPASSALKGVDPSDEDSAARAMSNLASLYAERTLDGDQSAKPYAVYWYRRAIDSGSVEALYGLARMHYMIGGADYELAALLLKYYWEVEGERSDEALGTLARMLDNGWLRDGWSCYPEILAILKEYTDADTTGAYLEFDEEKPADGLTVDAYFDEPAEYPGTVEEQETGRRKSDMLEVLLNLGIPAQKRAAGGCSVRIRDCPDLAERVARYGYEVKESNGKFLVKEPKPKKPKA